MRVLGKGVYTLSEVARLTRLHPNTVRAWFSPNNGVFLSDYTNSADRTVSFHDLIDTLVAGRLREEGVSLQTIRKAYDALKSHLGPHPFSNSRIGTDGKRVFQLVLGNIQDRRLIEAVQGQHHFDRVLQPYVRVIEYDAVSQMAIRWNPAPDVMIDPRVRLGQPVVRGTGKPTWLVAKAYHANDSNTQYVAEMLEMDESSVLAAVAFEDSLSRKCAA